MTPRELEVTLRERGIGLWLEAGRVVVEVDPDGARPTAEELRAVKAMQARLVTYMTARDHGIEYMHVSLYQLGRILEVAVPWSDVRLLIAPGCRIARELRASDPRPGRVWCVCEVLDLLLSGVTPEDARGMAEARTMFDATLAGFTAGAYPPSDLGLRGERRGRS
jgi:hypothetical protein